MSISALLHVFGIILSTTKAIDCLALNSSHPLVYGHLHGNVTLEWSYTSHADDLIVFAKICRVKDDIHGEMPIYYSNSGASDLQPFKKNQDYLNRTRLSVSNQIVSFTLIGIREHDAGGYLFKMMGTPTKETVIELVLIEPPRVMRSPRSPVSILEGSNTSLSCQVEEGNARPYLFTWTFQNNSDDGAPVELLHRTESQVLNLSLTDVHRSTAGTYICRVSNRFGDETMREIRLVVQYALERVDLLMNGRKYIDSALVFVEANQTVIIACEADSSPEPQVHVKRVSTGVLLPTSRNAHIIGSFSSVNNDYYECIVHDSFFNVTMTTSIHISVGIAPTLSLRPQNATITEGDGSVVSFNCSADAWPTERWIWSKDGFNMDEESGTLVFTNAIKTDSGEYSCQAQNRLGVSEKAVAFLEVMYPPVISTSFKNKTVNEGDIVTLMLSCRAVDANPQVTRWLWKKDGLPLLNKRHSTRRVGLMVESRRDAGVYTCEAYNVVGVSRTLALRIDVNYRPNVTATQPKMIVEETNQQDVLFSCSADANPKVDKWLWKKDGKLLDTMTDELQIKSANKEDAGSYTCEAQNSVGVSNAASMLLDVQYPPIVTTSTHKTFAVESKREDISFRCMADANPSTDAWLWKKDGMVLGTTTNEHLIKSAKKEDAGTYSCQAHNSAGYSNEVLMRLNVLYRPLISTDFKNITVNEADQEMLTLVCHAVDANPKVTRWLWKKDGNLLRANSRKVLLMSVSRHDAGVYTCEAYNDVGASHAHALRIDVNFRPEITRSPDSLVVVANNAKVSLDCSADGSPSPHIRWNYTNTFIAHGPRLFLTNFSRSEEGTYSCIAENLLGRKSSTFTVLLDNTVRPVLNPAGSANNDNPRSTSLSIGTIFAVAVGVVGFMFVSALLVHVYRKYRGRRSDGIDLVSTPPRSVLPTCPHACVDVPGTVVSIHSNRRRGSISPLLSSPEHAADNTTIMKLAFEGVDGELSCDPRNLTAIMKDALETSVHSKEIANYLLSDTLSIDTGASGSLTDHVDASLETHKIKQQHQSGDDGLVDEPPSFSCWKDGLTSPRRNEQCTTQSLGTLPDVRPLQSSQLEISMPLAKNVLYELDVDEQMKSEGYKEPVLSPVIEIEASVNAYNGSDVSMSSALADGDGEGNGAINSSINAYAGSDVSMASADANVGFDKSGHKVNTLIYDCEGSDVSMDSDDAVESDDAVNASVNDYDGSDDSSHDEEEYVVAKINAMVNRYSGSDVSVSSSEEDFDVSELCDDVRVLADVDAAVNGYSGSDISCASYDVSYVPASGDVSNGAVSCPRDEADPGSEDVVKSMHGVTVRPCEELA